MRIQNKQMFRVFMGPVLIYAWLGAQVPAFNADRAYAYLKTQCDFGPRNPGSEGHQKCLDYLFNTLKTQSCRVVRQPFHQVLPGTSKMVLMTNLIASFGDQPDRILICAHWDTRPVADLDPDPSKRNMPISGANDGASGVAVILELAEILKQNSPPIGVDLVLFDGEDAGLEGQWDTWCLGSRYYANSGWLQRRPQYAILLDMVGDKDLEFPIEYYSNLYAPDLVDMVWSRAEMLGLDAFSRNDGPAVIDDHLNLLKVGIPAVNIIDFEYPAWHTLDDTPDKCSPESLGIVGRLLTHLIYVPD